MTSMHKETIPKYQQIALELASQISSGSYLEGEKLFGRSHVASKYNVSPETARKAFCILADLDIISPKKGSGMYVKSKANAASFVSQFSKSTNIERMKKNIFVNIQKQKDEMELLKENLESLISATELYRSINPLVPHLIPITSECRFLGETLKDIQFWQNTGGTVVASRRDGELMISPGSYLTLLEGDIISVVTQESADQRVREFLYETPGEVSSF